MTEIEDPAILDPVDAVLNRYPPEFRKDALDRAHHLVIYGKDAPDLPGMVGDDKSPTFIEWKIDPIQHGLVFTKEEEGRQDIKSKQCVNFSLSDDGNARRIMHRFGRDLRYCFQTDSWYVWDGCRWRRDEIGLVREIAKNVMVRVVDEAENLDPASYGWKEHLKFAGKSLNKSRIDNAVSLAQSINAVVVDDLDRDGYLLNLRNGTLNLKTWEFTTHRRADLITKCAGVDYIPDADCPIWKSHLSKIFGGDAKFIDELQEIFGYCLMAGNPEEILLIAHGSGSNGKSKTKEALAFILGDYAVNLDAQSLMVQKYNNGPRSDIARLRGARLITANESEAGSRLAESKIKELTGADRVTARALYEAEQEFTMSGKILLCTNHKPKVYGQDPAIWRRLWLLPFEVTIPKDERDYHLQEKLQAEGSGILNWLLVGFRKYYIRGRLPDSERINAASRAYKADSDLLGEFLMDFEVTGNKEDYIPRSDLYNAYKLTVDSSEKPIPKNKFAMMIQERIGKAPARDREKGWCWVGIRRKNDGQQNIL